MNGLSGCKIATNLAPIPNEINKLITVMMVSDRQKTNYLAEELPCSPDPVAGFYQQTENRQDALQDWLEETYARLLFLSKNERLASFSRFISSISDKLFQRETSEKNTLDFLLALDDFFSNKPSLLFPTRFFIEKLLEDYRLIIKDYRQCSVNFVSRKEVTEQSKKIEKKKHLRIEAKKLKKEKKMLLEEQKEKESLLNKQKALNIGDEILSLIEITKDLDKFKIERARNFDDEIIFNEENLQSYKEELDKISKKIKGELEFNVEHIGSNIKIKRRQIMNRIFDLDTLDKLQETIDGFDLKNIIELQQILEQNRDQLILKINKINPKSILMRQLEDEYERNSKDSILTNGKFKNKLINYFASEEEIRSDLRKNRENLDNINLLLQPMEKLIVTNGEDKIISFFEKLKYNLRLAYDKKNIEDEQEKIIKQCEITARRQAILAKKLREDDKVKNLKEKIEINKDRLNSTKEKYYKNQKELIIFLNDNNMELVVLIKDFLIKKRKEIEKDKSELNNEKEKLELFDKKDKLVNEISKLEENISKIKKDKNVWRMLVDYGLMKILSLMDKLEELLKGSGEEIKKLEEQLNKLESKLRGIKEKFYNLKQKYYEDKERHGKEEVKYYKEKENFYKEEEMFCKEKEKYLTKIDECVKELLKNEKEFHDGEAAQETYRSQVECIINEIKSGARLRLQQNAREIRFNSMDTRRLMAKIERQKLRDKQGKLKDLLLQSVVKSSQDNDTRRTEVEKFFFDYFIASFRDLKEQVNRSEWNKHGWGFFRKKLPDGIQKVRLLLDKMPLEDIDSAYHERHLLMLSCFSGIYHLMKQKNSSKKCLRSATVKRFYQLMEQSLEALHQKLKEVMDPDWFRILLANPMANSNQAIDFPSNHLFKQQALELADRIQFPIYSSFSKATDSIAGVR